MDKEMWNREKSTRGEHGLSWVVYFPCVLDSWHEPCTLISKRDRTNICSPRPGGCFDFPFFFSMTVFSLICTHLGN